MVVFHIAVLIIMITPGNGLVWNDYVISIFPEFQTLGYIVEIPSVHKIFTPRDIILCCQQQSVYSICFCRLSDDSIRKVHVHRCTVMIYVSGIPGCYGQCLRLDFGSADASGKSDIRVLLKKAQKIGNKVFMNNKYVLMQIDFIFRIGTIHSCIISGGHGGRLFYGDNIFFISIR